jgi:hypothetical protein
MNRDSISGRPATIKVGRGPHAGVFTVQKALLCSSSTYFKAALNGTFVEGHTQTIDLDDEDPSIFRTYVAWLYQGSLRSLDIEIELDDPQDFGQHIAGVIVFADKRDIGDLKNDAISMLLSYLEQTGLPTLEVINCIYELPKSAEISGLRQLLARNEVHFGDRLEENIDRWHPEYLATIIKAYKELGSNKSPDPCFLDRTNLCKLMHKHTTEQPSCTSLAFNQYLMIPRAGQLPPKKKRKTVPSTQTFEILDD